MLVTLQGNLHNAIAQKEHQVQQTKGQVDSYHATHYSLPNEEVTVYGLLGQGLATTLTEG